MSTIAEQVREVRESAEHMNAAETQTAGSLAEFDNIRQGDLYIIKVPKKIEGEKTDVRQLAEGTTQGTRHILTGDCTVVKPDVSAVARYINDNIKGANVEPELVAPAFTVGPKGCELTHPEHGNWILPADSSWAVVHQRSHADEVRRAQD